MIYMMRSKDNVEDTTEIGVVSMMDTTEIGVYLICYDFG